MPEKKLFRAALYARVSKEDFDSEDGKGLSHSIQNQRILLKEFVDTQDDILLCSERMDDGYSGGRFERPAFLAMMKDIENGTINCVIVKDLSRFGRDYIEVGRYMERIFPAFGVRFIALHDFYDSMEQGNPSSHLYLPFRNLMNDAYLKDISIKIRSHLEVKQRMGEFVGAFPVYGYQKSETDPHKLLPDWDAADVVKQIFEWKLEGFSHRGIAEKLNELGEPSPAEYKKAKGFRYQTAFISHYTAKWSATAVGRILKDEIYRGVLQQGKRSAPNHKAKSFLRKPEEWIRVENTHLPLVSKELFETVRELLKKNVRIAPRAEKSYPFSGFLVCGDCKEPLIRKCVKRKGKEYSYYLCATHKQKGCCSGHRISEKQLEDMLTQCFTLQIGLTEMPIFCELEQWNMKHGTYEGLIKMSEKKELWMKLEFERCEGLLRSLCENREKGILSKEEYQMFRDTLTIRCTELKNAILVRKAEQNHLSNAIREDELLQERKSVDSPPIDRRLMLKLCHKIMVYEGKKITIVVNGSEEMRALKGQGRNEGDYGQQTKSEAHRGKGNHRSLH